MSATWVRPRTPVRGAVDRWWQLASLVLVASLAANLAMIGFSGRTRMAPSLLGLSFIVYGAVGVALAIRAWRHPNLDRRTRQAFGVIAVAFLLLLGSAVLRRLYPIGTAFPSPADLLRLLFGPVLLAGLMLLPARRQGRREQQQVWLDVTVVVIASAVLLWFLEIGPSVTSGHVGGRALAAAFAYPVIDLALVFGATALLFRGAAESVRKPATTLGAAMIALVVGDMLLGYQQSRGSIAGASQWQFACWMLGHFLLMMAAFIQCRQAGHHRLTTEAPRARSVSTLPYLAIGLCYGLLIFAVSDLSPQVLGTVAGTAAITAVVAARQILASRENHELATTDALTGLSNRRKLYDLLGLALARAERNRQRVAALSVDMNGFKQINDTLGHEAGDRMLVAFSRILRRNVLGLDAVGRLGGDEFAIVLHDIGNPDNVRTVVDRIIADLQHPVLIGEILVQPRASIGVALSAPGRFTADQLLHQADVAMYQAKAATRETDVTSVVFAAEPVATRPAPDTDGAPG